MLIIWDRTDPRYMCQLFRNSSILHQNQEAVCGPTPRKVPGLRSGSKVKSLLSQIISFRNPQFWDMDSVVHFVFPLRLSTKQEQIILAVVNDRNDDWTVLSLVTAVNSDISPNLGGFLASSIHKKHNLFYKSYFTYFLSIRKNTYALDLIDHRWNELSSHLHFAPRSAP